MRRAWKILFALLLGTAATLASGQIYSSQSGLLSADDRLMPNHQELRIPNGMVDRRFVCVSATIHCVGPLERDCILPTCPPLRYNLPTFLLDTLFLSTISYGLIPIAGLSRRHLFAKLRRSVPSPGGAGLFVIDRQDL